MVLRDTLTNMKTARDQEEERKNQIPALIEAWQATIADLIKTAKTFLSDLEKEGLLSFGKKAGFGNQSYSVEALLIQAQGKTLMLEPGVRYITGALGSAELCSVSNPALKVPMLLLADASNENAPVWHIAYVFSNRALDITNRQPLTKETLEDAVEYLVRV
jgi:hypothetical protein